MKKEKLSLDKLTVAKLSHTKNIFGGRDPDMIDIGGYSVPAGPTPNNSSMICNLPANWQDTIMSITPPEMRRSSKICAG